MHGIARWIGIARQIALNISGRLVRGDLVYRKAAEFLINQVCSAVCGKRSAWAFAQPRAIMWVGAHTEFTQIPWQQQTKSISA